MMDLKVLNLPLTILKVTGLDPRDNTMLSKVKCFILFVTIFILLVTSMMEIQGQKRSIISIVSEIEAFMAAMEGVLRWSTFVIFKKQIFEVIQESRTLWNINEADPDDESGASSTIRFLWIGMRIYAILIFSSCSITILIPIFFTWREDLPLTAWFPQNYLFGYEILYITQALSITGIACMIIGVDTIFGALCAILIAQFKLLNRKLVNTKHIATNKDFMLNLQQGVHYHLKLIEFGKAVANTYSGLLLVQYVLTAGIACAELYTVSDLSIINSSSQIARCLLYEASLMCQMGIFCFLAEAVMDASENISMAVYSSDWYSRDIKEANLYLQMITRRASAPVTFTGGGLILIGKVAWINVFKMSFSVFTLLSSKK